MRGSCADRNARRQEAERTIALQSHLEPELAGPEARQGELCIEVLFEAILCGAQGLLRCAVEYMMQRAVLLVLTKGSMYMRIAENLRARAAQGSGGRVPV